MCVCRCASKRDIEKVQCFCECILQPITDLFPWWKTHSSPFSERSSFFPSSLPSSALAETTRFFASSASLSSLEISCSCSAAHAGNTWWVFNVATNTENLTLLCISKYYFVRYLFVIFRCKNIYKVICVHALHGSCSCYLAGVFFGSSVFHFSFANIDRTIDIKSWVMFSLQSCHFKRWNTPK